MQSSATGAAHANAAHPDGGSSRDLRAPLPADRTHLTRNWGRNPNSFERDTCIQPGLPFPEPRGFENVPKTAESAGRFQRGLPFKANDSNKKPKPQVVIRRHGTAPLGTHGYTPCFATEMMFWFPCQRHGRSENRAHGRSKNRQLKCACIFCRLPWSASSGTHAPCVLSPKHE